MHRFLRNLSSLIVGTLVLMAGCSESSGPSARTVNQLPSLIVSSPVSQSAGVSAGASADVVVGTAWVSLPPASVASGQSATIRNGRSGANFTVALVDGGFDPIAISASVDDTVFVDITGSGNGTPLTGFQVIAIRKAPSVVRTSPPRGKNDVPLNAAIVVVFSAPIDPATLSASAFGLLRGGTPVAGSVRPVGTNGISAEFYPDSTLAPQTSYQLFVTQAIHDVSGVPLAQAVTDTFSTAVPSAPVSVAQSGARPGDSLLLADGASTTGVVVWLRDANGHSIQNMADSIILTTTLGSLGTVTGGTNGVYGATLTAPAAIGTAVVTARIGSLTLGSFSVRFALHQLWIRKAGMPYDFTNTAAAPVNATVYVAGGWWRWTDELQPLGTGNELYAYDPVTNAWAQRANMPGDRAALAMGSINGILYAVGGYGDQGPATNSLYAYDPRTDHWNVLAPMPTARARLAVAVVGGMLYAVGGENSSGTASLHTVEAYDPATDRWTTKASMPTARAGLAASEVHGILYAVGGDASPNPNNVLEAYDPATDRWTTKASMPTGSKGLAAVALGARLFAVSTDSIATLQSYDPATNSWSVLTPSPVGSSGSSYGIVASLVNGSIFMVEGFGNSAMWVP